MSFFSLWNSNPPPPTWPLVPFLFFLALGGFFGTDAEVGWVLMILCFRRVEPRGRVRRKLGGRGRRWRWRGGGGVGRVEWGVGELGRRGWEDGE